MSFAMSFVMSSVVVVESRVVVLEWLMMSSISRAGTTSQRMFDAASQNVFKIVVMFVGTLKVWMMS